MIRRDNFGDSILIKKIYDKKLNTIKAELFGCPGNRFFIHYKTLVLNEELNDLDLLFEPEPGKLAKWII